MLYLPKIPLLIPEEESRDYSVLINEKECFVHFCRVSKIPFNMPWPGHQRDKSQSELASFISFFGDEKVTLKVKCKKPFKKAVVRPLSKKVEVSFVGDEVCFTLEENGSYTLELDEHHGALHIFYSKKKDYPEKENATYYFGPGVHCPILITLKDNDSVYIDPEAIVYTTIFANGAKNVRIFGGGNLDNSCQERIMRSCADTMPIGNIRMFYTDNIVIEDVILRDSCLWVLSLFNCNNIVINDVKIIGQWRYNTDGIDITNSSNAKIKNCFIRSFDDGIVIKAINDHTICENIEVENCVLWCDWGKTLELGLETACDEYKNMSFKNCDCIHNATAAMAVSNGHYANIHDIHYENINVEFQKATMPMTLQTSEDMLYPGYDKTENASLLSIDNHKMSAHAMYKNANLANEKDKNFGTNHDITYNNINIYAEEGIDTIYLLLRSCCDKNKIDNVHLNNVFINGKKVESLDAFTIYIKENIENITLNGMPIK